MEQGIQLFTLKHCPQPIFLHIAEKNMLRNQLSRLRSEPPTPKILEKIEHLDDRLKFISEHETKNDCIGGDQCTLNAKQVVLAASGEKPKKSTPKSSAGKIYFRLPVQSKTKKTETQKGSRASKDGEKEKNLVSLNNTRTNKKYF